MMDDDCVWKCAEYSMFYIEDAAAKYELHIGGYSVNARISNLFFHVTLLAEEKDILKVHYILRFNKFSYIKYI